MPGSAPLSRGAGSDEKAALGPNLPLLEPCQVRQDDDDNNNLAVFIKMKSGPCSLRDAGAPWAEARLQTPYGDREEAELGTP